MTKQKQTYTTLLLLLALTRPTWADPPPPPSNLSAIVTSATSVDLTWNDNAPTEREFRVWWRVHGIDEWPDGVMGLPPNVGSYTITDLNPITSYEVTVAANNHQGDSLGNPIASFTTPEEIPNTPSNLSVTVQSESTVTVEWADESDVETDYRAWWRESGEPTWTHIESGLGANTSTFTITGTSPGTNYEVTVVASNLQGTSLNNPVAPFSTPGGSQTPQSLVSDFNGDGTVGFPDFLLFAGAFGSSATDDGWDVRFDLDGDGSVGFGDFLVFVTHFG